MAAASKDGVPAARQSGIKRVHSAVKINEQQQLSRFRRHQKNAASALGNAT